MAQDKIFLGMVGAGHWDTGLGGQRPTNYREKIFYLSPNGRVPLTGMLSKTDKKSTDDPRFTWYNQLTPRQGGTLTGIYTEASLSTTYASQYPTGATADVMVYCKAAELVIEEIRIGHTVSLTSSEYPQVAVQGMVTDRVLNGASSYVAVKLLEADDNAASYNVYLGTAATGANLILVSGNANEEGSTVPSELVYEPDDHYNYTEIFKTAIKMSRTALRTRLRTRDARKRYRQDMLLRHGLEMEKAFLYGVRRVITGDGGLPKRFTWGAIPQTLTNAPADNIDDFRHNSEYAGSDWEDVGTDWLDDIMYNHGKWGEMDKIAFVGNGALKGINKAVKKSSTYEINDQTIAYGIRVKTLHSAVQTLHMYQHPLFTYGGDNDNSMFIFQLDSFTYRDLDDTKLVVLKGDPSDPDSQGFDGILEQFITEAGLEYGHAQVMGYYTGIGQDSKI